MSMVRNSACAGAQTTSYRFDIEGEIGPYPETGAANMSAAGKAASQTQEGP